jgi:PAS domain S-box-containing protein
MTEISARARILDGTPQQQGAGSSTPSESSSFRSLVEASLQGIIVHRDWQILFANRAAAFILGYDTVAELVSVGNTLSLYPQEEHTRMERYRDARLRREPTPERYHIRLLHKNGSIIWVELLASVLDWQGEPALQSAFVDISESVRTQQLLRESEERYSLAMDGANEGMWDWHIETDSLFVSANLWRHLGMPARDEVLSRAEWIERIHPDDREHMRASLVAHLRGEQEYFHGEHRVRVKDNSYRWFHVHALALRHGNGRAYRLAGSVHDITSRKASEQALSERLRFEALLTQVSAEFIALPPSEIDAAIERSLGTIGEFLEVDRGWFLQIDKNRRDLSYTHEWCGEGIAPQRHNEDTAYYPADRFPWYWRQLLSGTPVVIASLDDFPLEASAERRFELDHGVQSLVSISMDVGGGTIGRLGFECVGRRRSWSDTVVNQLTILGHVITNAIVRKQTDIALRESEELLRTFMDNTPAMMTLKSLDNRYLLVNRAFQEFARMSGNDTIGSTPSQVMTGEHARSIAEHDQMVLDADGAVTVDRDLRQLDGARYRRRVTQFPVYDADEKLIGIGSNAMDISAWKQAAEALQESESLIKAISANLPGALFRRVLHTDGHLEFTFISNSLHRVLGIDSDRVVNDAQALIEAYHPEDRIRWMEALRQSADTLQQMSMDVRVYDPSGATRWMRTLARPQKLDNGTVVWDGLALDVTEEKNAGEALRESEERFRNLVEGSLQGIAIVDTGFSPLFVNNAYALMFGYADTEDMQRLDSHLSLFSPSEREQLLAFGEARLRGDPIPITYELDGIRKDGQVMHLVNTMRLIAWRGRPAFQITATDISERKRTEERLRDYQQQLRRLASEISLAEEKERRRIASQLHDGTIQNLALAKIKLGKFEKGLAPQRHDETLDEIRELLELSIHDARSLIFELSPPVLYELGLGAAIEWLGEQFQTRHGIICRVEASQNNAPLNVDIEVILFQVLRELLVNVVKHANATRVDVSLRRMGDRLSLQVGDDGDGFDAAAVVTGSGSGGFGLFNIRERLQLLGATFEIESGTGTRVTITAPLAAGPEEESP